MCTRDWRPARPSAAAQAELRQIAARLHETYPAAYPKARRASIPCVTPWKDELTAKARPTLMILLVTTVFVLVIACANVANLTLTRLVQREREMAIRAALGAPGALLRRQLLAENLVLSVLGGALGLGLAVSGLDLLIEYAEPIHEPHRGDRARRLGAWLHAGRLDCAWRCSSRGRRVSTFVNDPVRAMASGGGRATGSIGRRRAQRALVVSQLAASFMLLIGAGLLTRTLMRLYAVDPGFDLSNVLSLQAPDFARTTANAGCSSRATCSSASGRRRPCSPLPWRRRRRSPDRFRNRGRFRVDGADPGRGRVGARRR